MLGEGYYHPMFGLNSIGILKNRLGAVMIITVLVFSGFFVFQEFVYAVEIPIATEIIFSVLIEDGGTGCFDTQSATTFCLTLPSGSSAEMQITNADVENPESGGNIITFLGNSVEMNVVPAGACSNTCDISWTFTDTNLAEAGLVDPADAVIFQDEDGDGTFVALVTTLIDGAPSPYTASAQITVTSFFGIGFTDTSVETFCGRTIDEFDSVKDGTEARDLLFGTKGDDLIRGFGGHDLILGRHGDDCIFGGEGRDLIFGGKGNDVIFGEQGNDRIVESYGDDEVHGGPGNDRIRVFFGNNELFGEEGDDNLRGGFGDDLLNGGNGFDSCKDTKGNNIIVECET